MSTGNDLLVQVKDNQPCLLDSLKVLTETDQLIECAETRGKARRNRSESRTVETFDLRQVVAGTGWEPYLATAIRVTRSTLIRSAATGLWTRRQQVA